MNVRNALLGLALLSPAMLYSTDAEAFAKCDAMDDAKAKKKCEKNMTKKLAKMRKNTEVMKPSELSPKLGFLDESNPFDMDDFYVGKRKDTGVAAVDEVVASVGKIDAALTMVQYVSVLAKDGKNDDAKKVATALMPELVKMKDEVAAIMENVNKIKADPASLVKDDPLALPKVTKNITAVATSLPGMIEKIPTALTTIKPLAAGAAGAAIQEGMDKAGMGGDKNPCNPCGK